VVPESVAGPGSSGTGTKRVFASPKPAGEYVNSESLTSADQGSGCKANEAERLERVAASSRLREVDSAAQGVPCRSQ
jgi:hypothetical protein